MEDKHFTDLENRLNGKTPIEGGDLTNYKIRVVRSDGQYRVVTRDYRRDRVNVEIENGIITKVISIG